ncbi:MAG: cytochrome c [Ignavibacteria bacterium]|jgi:cytochrome c|nr:cytochrome c [Ignavibacteria bacterium]MCU7497752.1 cytochrome c [Ignavibacteria bacterium]MCU7510943.1 cytochrome c [Ignavibacteria bacterium]MCU7518796.1 cytochrome c [Ignavibacteria bacterium]MCU7523234.1 cytochrome c [Ignavibacteria bacterium]
MEFLNRLVIPQSAENLTLLRYILVLALILFLPYLAFLKGITLYSVAINFLGRKKGNENHIRFSKDLIDIVTFTKSIAIVLGIIPVISLILIYSQLLHASKMGVVSFIFIAGLLFVPAVILIYSYKYTFNLDWLLRHPEGKSPEGKGPEGVPGGLEEGTSELEAFRKSNLKVSRRSGIWGVILLFISSYLIIAAIQLSFQPEIWSQKHTFFGTIFSMNAIYKYVFFLIATIAVTSGAILFYYFSWKKPAGVVKSEYADSIERFCLITGIWAVIVLPVFILISLFVVPKGAVSDPFFALSLLILLILFALGHYYFMMIKQPGTNYSSYIFFLLLIFFVLFTVNDQVAFSYATQRQELALAANYDAIQKEKMEKAGKGPAISGKDIFDGRCSACHRFDRVLVGPAYKNVLPKYEGKRDQLIAFISNPTKKNPAFPAMPNQGLKPKEVEAIADYIMKTYKQYK